MSQVRMFRVPNKLRQKILKAGGMRTIEALAKGQDALDALREPSLAQIDQVLVEINRTFGRANRKGDEDLLPLYMLSTRIIDAAAPVSELEIDRAAFHLCSLLDRCMALGRHDWPAVDVHLDALQLLRMDEGKLPEAARASIFAGLQKVHDRLPPAPAPAAEPEAEADPVEAQA
jgi:hypothetical protein